MKFSELSDKVLERLKQRQYDLILQKHEGGWTWESIIKHNECEFIKAGEHFVLLPIYSESYPHIKILRVVESVDGKTLTIFLKDTTFVEDRKREFFDAGFVAVCDKFEGEDFFTAILYHEWFMIENLN